MRRRLENMWRTYTDIVDVLMEIEAQGRDGGGARGRILRWWELQVSVRPGRFLCGVVGRCVALRACQGSSRS